MSDRKVLVRFYRDAHNPGDWRESSLGEVGEYRHAVVFRRAGMARRFEMEFSVTSPIRADYMGAVADVEVGE